MVWSKGESHSWSSRSATPSSTRITALRPFRRSRCGRSRAPRRNTSSSRFHRATARSGSRPRTPSMWACVTWSTAKGSTRSSRSCARSTWKSPPTGPAATRRTARSWRPGTSTRWPRSSATSGGVISTGACPPARSACWQRHVRCWSASWRWPSSPTRSGRTPSSTRSCPPQPRPDARSVTEHDPGGHPAPTGRVAAVVPAAGSGVRLGAGVPKAFVELEGRTMLERAVTGLLDSGAVDDVVVVVPRDRVAQAVAVLAPLRAGGHLVAVTTGGAERTDSVRNGLAALAALHGGAGAAVYDVLLEHDAARCLTHAAPIRRVVEAVRSGDVAVVPVLPVVDTVKQVDVDGYVVGTPDRSTLRAVQTP